MLMDNMWERTILSNCKSFCSRKYNTPFDSQKGLHVQKKIE